MKNCHMCGAEFKPTRVNHVRCSGCKGKPRKKKACPDCGIMIRASASRCFECANVQRRGTGNPNFRGRRFTTQGYVVILSDETRDHPNAQATGVIMEHILVMSRVLGRPLKRGEEVHHKNGIRSDNRPENLELWTRSHPTGVRVVDLYAWCQGFIKQYEGDIRSLGSIG